MTRFFALLDDDLVVADRSVGDAFALVDGSWVSVNWADAFFKAKLVSEDEAAPELAGAPPHPFSSTARQEGPA